MNLSIEIAEEEHVRSRLSGILGCSTDPEILAETMRAEYCRAAICRGLLQGNFRPMHSNSVASIVDRRMGFFKAGLSLVDDFGIPHLLRKLSHIGDLLSLGHGLWAPAPTRLIRLSDSGAGDALILGGVPFDLLPEGFKRQMNSFGVVRSISEFGRDVDSYDASHTVIGIDDWYGGQRTALSGWAVQAKTELNRKMKPVRDFRAQDSDVYLPNVKNNYSPWLPASNADLALRVPNLYRFKPDTKGPINYLWGTLRRDGVRGVFFDKLADIPEDIRLRLMFGLDQLNGRRRTVSIKQRDKQVSMSLAFGLPEPERKVLDLGQVKSIGKHGYPDKYIFPSVVLPLIHEAMSRLGIVVEE